MAAFVVAVTGGIASGKSALCACFAALGVVVVDADLIAHEIVAPGGAALDEIAARFGAGVLLADGSLDRARMRERVFADSGARAELEAITHPRIRAELEARCRAARGPYSIADIPLLTETRAGEAWRWLQRVLVVDAPEALQRERLLRRDGIDAALAARMLAAQASRRQRLALADDVVINDGPLSALAAATQRLDARFRRLAAA
jgi:dephospho-CoA kinase